MIIILASKPPHFLHLDGKAPLFLAQIITIVQEGLVIISAFLKGQHPGDNFLCLIENAQSIKNISFQSFSSQKHKKKLIFFFFLSFASDEFHIASHHNNKVRSQCEIICCR